MKMMIVEDAEIERDGERNFLEFFLVILPGVLKNCEDDEGSEKMKSEASVLIQREGFLNLPF